MPAVDIDPNQLEMALLKSCRERQRRDGLGRRPHNPTIAAKCRGRGSARHPIRAICRSFGTGHRRRNGRRNPGESRGAIFFDEGSWQGNWTRLIDDFGSRAAVRRRSAARKHAGDRHDRQALAADCNGSFAFFPGASNTVIKDIARARILFVDDDVLIAGSTVALLEDLGHEVVEVHSAQEALRLLEGGLPTDLLITDHAMPGMTGVELAREVRRRRPQLPILLATGFAEFEGNKVSDVVRLASPIPRLSLPPRSRACVRCEG